MARTGEPLVGFRISRKNICHATDIAHIERRRCHFRITLANSSSCSFISRSTRYLSGDRFGNYERHQRRYIQSIMRDKITYFSVVGRLIGEREITDLRLLCHGDTKFAQIGCAGDLNAIVITRTLLLRYL